MTSTHDTPFIPKTPEDALALEIARSFGDVGRLPHYRRICAGHDRSVVYKAFREAMVTPPHRVKKSRRALFLFILNAYDQQDNARN